MRELRRNERWRFANDGRQAVQDLVVVKPKLVPESNFNADEVDCVSDQLVQDFEPVRFYLIDVGMSWGTLVSHAEAVYQHVLVARRGGTRRNYACVEICGQLWQATACSYFCPFLC